MCRMSVFLFCLFVSFVSLSLVSSHMEMKYPAPRLSPYAGVWDYTQVDYDINAPLVMKGQKLCQGKAVNTPTATFTAGQTVNVEMLGGAPHKGGHCQFSLSYDGGNTFVVIKDYLRTCPLSQYYAVQIPSSAPASDKVVFAWSWINAEGNREYYMNCADIIIKNSNAAYAKDGTVTGPKMLIANMPGYPTVPEFMGNTETGLELFNSRPTITVRSSGSSTSTPSTPSVPTTPTPTTPTPTTPTPTPTTPTPSPPTDTSNCQCQWAAYCGADSCGRTGSASACKCSSSQVCMGGPSFQCRAPGAGGAPAPSTPSTPSTPSSPTAPSAPAAGSNCRCLWASYCGADTCGVQGANSACKCSSGKTCTGGPYWQCQ